MYTVIGFTGKGFVRSARGFYHLALELLDEWEKTGLFEWAYILDESNEIPVTLDTFGNIPFEN